MAISGGERPRKQGERKWQVREREGERESDVWFGERSDAMQRVDKQATFVVNDTTTRVRGAQLRVDVG